MLKNLNCVFFWRFYYRKNLFFSLAAYKVYILIVFPIFICLPLFGVIILSLWITLIVTSHVKTSKRKFSSPDTTPTSKVKSSNKKYKKQKQAILQLLLIAFCFIIGYIPIFGCFKLYTLFLFFVIKIQLKVIFWS